MQGNTNSTSTNQEEVLLGYPPLEFADDIGNVALEYLYTNMGTLGRALCEEPSQKNSKKEVEQSIFKIYNKFAEALNVQLDIYEDAIYNLVFKIPNMIKLDLLQAKMKELEETGKTSAESSSENPSTTQTSMSLVVATELTSQLTENMQYDTELDLLRKEYLRGALYRFALTKVKQDLTENIEKIQELEKLDTQNIIFANTNNTVKKPTPAIDKNVRSFLPKEPIIQSSKNIMPALLSSYKEYVQSSNFLNQIAHTNSTISNELLTQDNIPTKPHALDIQELIEQQTKSAQNDNSTPQRHKRSKKNKDTSEVPLDWSKLLETQNNTTGDKSMMNMLNLFTKK